MFTAKQVAAVLASVGYEPIDVIEADEDGDGEISFIGWHIQVGHDYVNVVIENPDGSFTFHPTISTKKKRDIAKIVKKIIEQ